MKQLPLEVVNASKWRVILLCEVGRHPKDTEEEQRPVSQACGLRRKMRKRKRHPSAVSEPPLKRGGFKLYQLVAIATEGEGTARTINLCKQCYTLRRLKQGQHLARDNSCAKCGKFQSKKRSVGQISFGSGKGKAKRNTRQMVTGDAVQRRAWGCQA